MFAQRFIGMATEDFTRYKNELESLGKSHGLSFLNGLASEPQSFSKSIPLSSGGPGTGIGLDGAGGIVGKLKTENEALRQENINTLQELARIQQELTQYHKRFVTDGPPGSSQDSAQTQELQTQISKLNIENRGLKEQLAVLKQDNQRYQQELQIYRSRQSGDSVISTLILSDFIEVFERQRERLDDLRQQSLGDDGLVRPLEDLYRLERDLMNAGRDKTLTPAGAKNLARDCFGRVLGSVVSACETSVKQRSELASSTARHPAAETEISRLSADNQKLKERLETIERSETALKEQVGILEKQLQITKSEHNPHSSEQLLKRIHDLDKLLSGFKLENEALRAELKKRPQITQSELEEMVSHRSFNLPIDSTLQNMLDQVKKHNETMAKQESERADSTVDAMIQKLTEQMEQHGADSDLDALEDVVSELTEFCVTLKRQNMDLKQEVDQFNEITQLREEAWSEKAASIEKARKQLDEKQKILRSKLDAYEDQFKQVLAMSDMAREDPQKVQKEHPLPFAQHFTHLRQLLASTEHTFERMRKEFTNREEVIGKLKNNIAAKQHEIDCLKEQMQERETTLQMTEKRKNMAEEMLQQLKQRIDKLEDEKLSLQSKLYRISEGFMKTMMTDY